MTRFFTSGTSGPSGRRRVRWCAARVGGLLLALAAAALAALAAHRSARDAQAGQQWPAAGVLVDVGGHRLHLRCMGEGAAPTLVFEAGMGGWSQDWSVVQPLLAHGGRVCSYDRAGYAWSDTPSPLPTGMRAVRDLHRLLDAAGVPSPRILVGHSMGGLLVGMYARTFPRDVAGLAFIDAVGRDYVAQFPPKRYAAFRTSLARLLSMASVLARWGVPQVAGQGASLVAARLPVHERSAAEAWSLTARHFQTLRDENAAFDRALEEARSLGPLPEVPVRVLSSGVMREFPPGLQDDVMRAAWSGNQRSIARQAGVQAQVLERSGHYLHLDDPAAVVRALQTLRAELREQARKS